MSRRINGALIMATKAVRFSTDEEKLINKFLKMNPMFDFSSLARMAILKFIENPQVDFKPVTPSRSKENQRSLRQ